MAKRARLIHFVGDGMFSPVLDSQVLVPLVLLGDYAPNLDRSIVCLTSVRHRGQAKVESRANEIREAVPGVRVHFEYRPFLDVPLQDRFWAQALERSISEWCFGEDDPIIVHCRGSGAGAAAAVLKQRDPRIRVLLDMRGDPLDEAARGGPIGWYRKWANGRMLARAISGADALNTVSRRLAEILTEDGFLSSRISQTVIGCCVDAARFCFDPAVRTRRRKELGFDDKFVICYCGAMSHWQRPDAIVDMFAAALQDMPDAHLLIISREADLLTPHLSRREVPAEHFTSRSASYDEVGSYLMAADVGLLLRENTRTNHVASPVKFAEYLRCGLPVILTPYIGDLADLVTRERVGWTIPFPFRKEEALDSARGIRAWLQAEGDQLRHRCSQVAFDRFSWDRNLSKLMGLYQGLTR